MKRLVLLFLSFLVYTLLQAQSTIPVTGGNATGTGGSVSYTVGQLVYYKNSGTNGTASEGVQQPYEISVITAAEQAKDISLSCSVYPNPTTDFLTLKVLNYNQENLSYWLYNVNGNLLLNKNVEGNEAQISMQNLPSGAYILKVADNGKEVKTFKIIKK